MRKQELPAAAAELRILMTILVKMARQEMQQHLDACGLNIGALEHGVMHMLYHKNLTIKDLSKHMGFEPASLVPVIDELERRQLVRRGIDPKDRRRTPLSLTTEGEQMLIAIPDVPKNSAFFKTLEGMGEEKVEELLLLMRELARGMMDDEKMVTGISESVRRKVSQTDRRNDKKASG